MRRICAISLPVFMLVVLAGCGVQGTWHLTELQPTIGYEDFTIARASFYPNHAFEAVAVRAGKTIKSKGTWDYNCCRKELVLMTEDKVLTYKAERKSCKELHVERQSEAGHAVTAIMCREPQCRPCKPCACRCSCK